MLCILAGVDQKYTYAVCFGGDDTSRAVFFFRFRCAPVPVHRQSGGHSCFMGMDLADPVSSGKYSGAFVFTALVAEPTVVLFTVPLNGFIIVATATGVTSYSSSADCFGSAAPLCCESVCVAMSCGGFFYSWWCLRFCLGQCEADDWTIHLHLFPVPKGRWVCMNAVLLVRQQ